MLLHTLAWLRAILSRPFVLLFLLPAMLAACTTGGPVRIVGEQKFSGISALLTDQQKALNIFIVHGMRADKARFSDGPPAGAPCQPQQTPIGKDVRLEVLQRLAPGDAAALRPALACRIPLLTDTPPAVTVDGQPAWTKETWAKARPFVEISDHRLSDGRRVTFVAFDYWPMLVSLKCKQLVQADQQLVGASEQSAYCQDYGLQPPDALANKPLPLNRDLKEGLVVWGLADALLVTSPLGEQMREALREAMAYEIVFAVARNAPPATAPAAASSRESFEMSGAFKPELFSFEALNALGLRTESVGALLNESPALKGQSWALVSESLGSYLSLRALDDGKATPPLKFLSTAVVCGASQVHMLANQVALLSLNEIGSASRPTAFSEACANSNLKPKQVVAYHDPNDALTYMLPAKAAGDATTYTDVVAPFAPVIIPFALANPLEAHVGQIRNKRIMDMVVKGD